MIVGTCDGSWFPKVGGDKITKRTPSSCLVVFIAAMESSFAGDAPERSGTVTVKRSIVREDGTPSARQIVELLPVVKTGGVISKDTESEREGSIFLRIRAPPVGKTEEE